MKTNSLKKIVVLPLILILILLLTGTYGQKNATATCETKNGLHVAKFSTPEGDIAVYFPGDGAAGDRICGTVISEPTGKNEKKMEKNKGVLEGYVFEMQEDKNNTTGVKADKFLWLIPLAAGEVMHLLMKDQNGNTLASADIPVDTEQPHVQFPESLTPADYSLPDIIQSGMPSTIAGCFNSDISKTAVTVGGQSAAILAESPRQCVFMAPENVTGSTNIQLTEGEVSTTGKANSLDLNLTAEKLTLTKGENTTIHLVISGLDGIQEPVPFEITNHSAETVTLSGGNEQNLEIEPSQVSAGGIYNQDFTVSAISAGSYTLVAEVAPPPPALITLVSPKGEINALSMIFGWNTLNIPSDATYTFKIWQVKEYQPGQQLANITVPYESVKNSTPYFIQEGISQQSFDYSQVTEPLLNPGYIYAWQVIALFPDGKIIESVLENLFCCGISDWEHVNEGPEKTKYMPKDKVPTHTKHIESGNNKTSYYNPDIPEGYEHVTTGNNVSVIIPEGYKHVETTGPDQSKYYPPYLIHKTSGADKSSYIPNGYDHIEKGPDASKYKPLNGEHIDAGADASKFRTQIHVNTGANPSVNEPGIVPPYAPEKPKDAEKPVKPKTMEEIKKLEKEKVDKEAQEAKKKIDEEAKKAKEQIDKEAKEKLEQDKKKK